MNAQFTIILKSTFGNDEQTDGSGFMQSRTSHIVQFQKRSSSPERLQGLPLDKLAAPYAWHLPGGSSLARPSNTPGIEENLNKQSRVICDPRHAGNYKGDVFTWACSSPKPRAEQKITQRVVD